MKAGQSDHLDKTASSRRRFLETTAQGASWLGLGAVLGWLAPQSQAQKPLTVKKGSQKPLGPEFTYDISHLQKTDPQLVLYELTAKFATGLKELRAIAVLAEEKIWTGGDQRLVLLDRNGNQVKTVSLAGSVRCLAVSPDQTLYAGLTDRICVLDSVGTLKQTWPSLGPKTVVTSLAVGDDQVFVADAGNRVVHRFNRAGKPIKVLGKKDLDRNIPGLIVPSPYLDIALGPEGLLWVANPGRHTMEAYTFDGDIELSWGEFSNGIRGFCGCCNPVHFARLPDGRFVTSEKGLTRVKIYSAKGEFIGVVAGPEEFPQYRDNPQVKPVGLEVAADAQGRVFVADFLSGDLRIYSPKKTATVKS
jgi:hypothetical protein